MLKRFLTGFFALLFVLSLSACSGSKKNGAVIAKYDGGEVTVAEIDTALANLPARVRSIAERQRKEFIESYVTEKLLLQEAEKRGVQHLADVQGLLKHARQKILVAKLIEQDVESKVDITPEQVRGYYDAHREEFMNPYRVKASHILLRSREEAVLARARVHKGEDFAALAKELSLDPTAVKGGDLGYFRKGQLIPEIEEAAFALDPGQTSDIVQTAFGYHLVQVTDISQPNEKDFNSVEREVHDKLLVEEKSKRFSELTERLRKKAAATAHLPKGFFGQRHLRTARPLAKVA